MNISPHRFSSAEPTEFYKQTKTPFNMLSFLQEVANEANEAPSANLNEPILVNELPWFLRQAVTEAQVASQDIESLKARKASSAFLAEKRAHNDAKARAAEDLARIQAMGRTDKGRKARAWMARAEEARAAEAMDAEARAAEAEKVASYDKVLSWLDDKDRYYFLFLAFTKSNF
jgi:hypothetical protein